jgi:hypothetical protein
MQSSLALFAHIKAIGHAFEYCPLAAIAVAAVDCVNDLLQYFLRIVLVHETNIVASQAPQLLAIELCGLEASDSSISLQLLRW